MNETDGVVYGERDVEVKDLHAELTQAVTDASEFIVRNVTDFEVRHCLWAGQSDDGKKHADTIQGDKPPFPWEGASDTRIRLTDEIVNDGVKLKMAAVKRSLMQAGPAEGNDATKSSGVTTYLKWLASSKMRENMRRELRLLANWMDGYAVTFLAVTWDEEERVNKRAVRLDELVAMIQTAGQQLDQAQAQGAQVPPEVLDQHRAALAALEALMDPTMDAETGVWLAGIFPGLKPGQARRAVKNLRENGECVVPERVVVRAQPLWTACRAFKDIFFPANTTEIQRAPWVAWREALTPVELRARVVSMDYDPEVVEECVEKCTGTSVLQAVPVESADQMAIDDMTNRIEVFTWYRKVVDADGYTSIVVTVSCPGVDEALVEFDLPAEHGTEYPVIAFAREQTERILIQNRSVPALTESAQNEVKVLRDFRTDRLSITQLPPVEVPMRRANDKISFGPAVMVPTLRPGEITFMKMPQFDPDSVGMERGVRMDMDSYFARAVEGVSPVRQQIYAQDDTDNWLDGLAQAWKMTLKLALANAPEEYARVTGQPVPTDIEHDILLDFNAADLNMDFVLKKLDVMKVVLSMDTMGVVDRSGLVSWAMRSIDPTLAQSIVKSAEEASNSEIEDEQVQLAKIFSGVEPEVKEGGNYALRLQVIQGTLQKNPQLMQRYQADEVYRAMIEARVKRFEFQLQQGQNAQIGRMGAMPALG